MPALSFKLRFGKAVENGVALIERRRRPWPGVRPKFQTLRARRKNPIHEGDDLYLFERQRSRDGRPLGKVTCRFVTPIHIDLGYSAHTGSLALARASRFSVSHQRTLTVAGTPYPLDELAKRDGVDSIWELVAFIEAEHDFPFVGDLISWDPARPWEK